MASPPHQSSKKQRNKLILIGTYTEETKKNNHIYQLKPEIYDFSPCVFTIGKISFVLYTQQGLRMY